MNDRLRLFDYFFLTRPILFFPGWATLLAGYATAGGAHQFISALRLGYFSVDYGNKSLALGLAAFAAAMGGCFVLNQLADIPSDKKNKKLFLLGDGFISTREGYIESVVLVSLSFILAFPVNIKLLVVVVLFNLVTGYFYNFKPFALKNRPLWGVAANMAMGWLAFCMGWLTFAPYAPTLFVASLPYLFFNTSLYFLTTMPDVKGDADSGKVTFPVKYGKSATINFSLFFFSLAFITSFWHKNEFMLVVSFLTWPFMIRLLVKKDVPSAIVAVKAGILFFALLVCVKFPLFLLLMATIFFFTRFYYKRRFDYDYPNFRGQ